jgi:hypothetical protein
MKTLLKWVVIPAAILTMLPVMLVFFGFTHTLIILGCLYALYRFASR